MSPDYSITSSGNAVGITAHTERAQKWIDENVVTEGHQWLGKTLWLDARVAEFVIPAMQNAGLTS